MDIDVTRLNRVELEELLDVVAGELLARDAEIEALAGWSLVSEWAREACLVAHGHMDVRDSW